MTANANTALIQPYTINRARTGWRSEEETLLWNEVKKARDEGRALKSVFDIVASETGRKPNSIRNYYYARARENPEESQRSPAFVPFSEQEIWDLLVTVLGEQAKGVSVRACTLHMGNNDTRAMLRYQNKYRSLVKTNPELVKEVVRSMRENNLPCIDPYEEGRNNRRAGRPRKENGIIDAKSLVQGVIDLTRLSEQIDNAQQRLTQLEYAVANMQGMQPQPYIQP